MSRTKVIRRKITPKTIQIEIDGQLLGFAKNIDEKLWAAYEPDGTTPVGDQTFLTARGASQVLIDRPPQEFVPAPAVSARLPANHEPLTVDLTADQLRHILNVFGVTITLFSRHCGIHYATALRWLSGSHDHKMPAIVGWVLLGYNTTPRLRHAETSRFWLPISDWMAMPAPANRMRTTGPMPGFKRKRAETAQVEAGAS